eukprot:9484959-Pyramimonas_sp.AAC.1
MWHFFGARKYLGEQLNSSVAVLPNKGAMAVLSPTLTEWLNKGLVAVSSPRIRRKRRTSRWV